MTNDQAALALALSLLAFVLLVGARAFPNPRHSAFTYGAGVVVVLLLIGYGASL